MERRLLCLDLDGTLLDDDGKLGGPSARALARLRRTGHLVCFVSGRTDVDMLNHRELCRNADFILLYNGGKLVETATGRCLFSESVAAGTARRLAEYCLREGLQLYLIMGSRYSVTQMTPGVADYARHTGVSPTPLGSPDELDRLPVESFISVGGCERVDAFIREAGLPLRCIPSEPNCCDIIPAGGGKWRGITRLAARVGIRPAEIIAAGNYINDIEMLEGAGTGIAVANALEEVRAAADYVTCRGNNQDAVEEIAQKFFQLT